MPISTIDKVMEIYKNRQTDLALDVGVKPYKVCRWIKSGVVHPEYILRVIHEAKKIDVRNKLPSRKDMAVSFLRDHQRKAAQK